jgi:hypothetical protein
LGLNIKDSKAMELLGKLQNLSSFYPPNIASQLEKRLLNCTLFNKDNNFPQVSTFIKENSIPKPFFTPILFTPNDNEFNNLQNQSIQIDFIESLNIFNCNGCTFKVNNIKCSVFIKNCSNCKFVLTTSQLRICECNCCKFIVYTTTGPVIEESSELVFSQLSESQDNKWNQIRNFNCKPDSFKLDPDPTC